MSWLLPDNAPDVLKCTGLTKSLERSTSHVHTGNIVMKCGFETGLSAQRFQIHEKKERKASHRAAVGCGTLSPVQ